MTNDFNDNVVTFDMPETLYGWDGEIPEEYANEHTIPDSINGIDLDSYIEITNETTDDPENEEHGTSFIVNSEMPNTINTGEMYSFNGEDERLSDLIADTMEKENTNSFAESLSYILHSTDSKLTSFKDDINGILEENDNGYVIFYNDDSNLIYMYDGADVQEIDMTKNNEYNINSEIVKLNIGTSTDDNIEFNCIIPLYDIVDINYKSNFNTIERLISANGTGFIDLVPSSSNKLYCENVPLGMWIYTDGETNDENTTSVKLYKDTESGFSQSWSLTISSQFKPFPYSSKMPSDMTTNSNTNAYATFAQVLASQAAMIDNFNKLSATIANMNDHIRNMESQLANIGTSYNIDNIHREFNNFEINMNNKFSVLKDEVINQLSYLKWKTTI